MRANEGEIDQMIEREIFHHYPGSTVVGCVLVTGFGYQAHGFSIAGDPDGFDLERGMEIARRNARGRLNGLEAYCRLKEKGEIR